MVRGAPADVSIDVATPADRVPVSRVLDGALLEVPELQDRLAAGTVLTAKDDGTVVGALVLDEGGPGRERVPESWPDATHVQAVAARRKRRHSGIGTALLRAAVDRWGPLTADFDQRVRPFYESLDAECRADADGRHWALLYDRRAGSEAGSRDG